MIVDLSSGVDWNVIFIAGDYFSGKVINIAVNIV